jgi:phosphotriesterase-related protein
VQEKILRAAIITSQETGLVIQSHTIGGEAITHVFDIFEETKFDASHFIWVHADSEPDLAFHIKAVQRGMWIEVDSIGTRPYEEHCFLLKSLLDAGLEDKVLLSQDAGWYNIGQVCGGQIRAYHTFFTEFIPVALRCGLDQTVLNKLIMVNPQKAFSIFEGLQR